MFVVDPEAVRRMADLVRAGPRAQIRATAIAGYTKIVVEAASRGDLETIRGVSLSFSHDGMASKLSTDEKHPWMPVDVPFAVRMARQLALEGRRPRLTLSISASVPGMPWRP